MGSSDTWWMLGPSLSLAPGFWTILGAYRGALSRAAVLGL